MATKKLATLTPQEEKAWESAFRFHATRGGQDRAGLRAWMDLRREFPRLRKFDGCRA
jgi:hypothetical protein